MFFTPIVCFFFSFRPKILVILIEQDIPITHKSHHNRACKSAVLMLMPNRKWRIILYLW